MRFPFNTLLCCLLFLLTGCASNLQSEAAKPRVVGFKAPLKTVPVMPQVDEIAFNDSAPYKTPPIPYLAQSGLIIIDPGHGGEDNGTKSLKKPLYLEKFFNLITAKFLATYLEQMGYQTLMTRTDDTFIPLKERAQFANERRPLLFVSVHYNAAPSQEAQGIEVFYYKSTEKPARADASRKLAASILSEIVKTTSANSRGVKQGNFAVIRETDMPAVLVEGGFLSHPEELEKLKDPSYLKKVAWGISQGIHRYLLTYPPKKF